MYVPIHLIYVKLKSVVKARHSYRYIALSYVWGEPQQLQLTGKTLPRLSTPRALDSTEADVPNTTRDAMVLSERLEESFLWVYSLCIDDENKPAQIAAMDRVYGNAVLTTIAAAGHNARAGLPGVQPGSISRSQHIETIQSLQLANRLSGKFDSIDCSAWNSRAWTNQERILSNRKLFISETQWNFMCRHTEIELCEDVYSQVCRRSKNSWQEGEKRSEIWSTNYAALDTAIPYGTVNTALYSRIV